MDNRRTEMVAELCKLGYAEKPAISHDAPLYTSELVGGLASDTVPNWNYTNISDNILPALTALGVDEDTITQIMVPNPARILAGARSTS